MSESIVVAMITGEGVCGMTVLDIIGIVLKWAYPQRSVCLWAS